MPWIDYRALRCRLDMEEVLAWMKWQANTCRGEYLRGNCPLCRPGVVCDTDGRSRDRDFVVHLGRKIYKCFRCHQGGDVLELWAKYRTTTLNAGAHELLTLLHDTPQAISSNPETQPPQPEI